MYLFDLVWQDCMHLRGDPLGIEIVHQLIRCSVSICANLEEAYGRGAGTADYLHIVLGEARETKGWNIRARQSLPTEVIDQRLDLIDEVISRLITLISRQKQYIQRS